jgi:hypothetical protein
MAAVTLGERGWLVVATLAVLGLCALPYVLADVWGPADLAFIGTFWFNHDFTQYRAAMREGARSTGWLIHDHFTAEPHQALLMYPLYVGAGKLAAALHMSDLTLFAAMEWLGRISLVAAVYGFAATFMQDARARRLALLLALGTLGLDVWGAFLHVVRDVNPYLEVSSFGVLLSAPHLMFGLALTLGCASLYLRAINGNRLAFALLALDVAVLALIHTFNVPVLVSVLAVHAVFTGRRAWLAALLAGVAAAPMVVYSALVFSADPFWSATYGAQNVMPSPPPWALPMDYGLVLIAAPLAWPIVKRWPAERRWLMLLWIGLGFVWMYAPVPFQRRLSFGVQPALAVLAAIGLVHLNVRVRSRRLVNYVAAVAGVSTSVFVYVALLASAVANEPTPVYLWTRAEANAAEWLGDHSTAGDVVLASNAYANPLAGSIDGGVVEGHTVATLDSHAKEALVQEFYGARTSTPERERLLQASGATVVAFGPHERALGATSLEGLSLDVIYDRDGVELFRVQR